MAKVTLSIPDNLYERIEVHKDQLNLSEIFRVCVSREIEKLQGKAEIIVKLEEYLMAKFPFESARKAEIDRFTQKWGEPEIIDPDNTPPYVKLRKNKPINVGNTTLASLKIFNQNAFFWSPTIAQNILEFNAEKWNDIGQGKLSHIVDYFRSKGFSVGEYFNGVVGGFNMGLTPPMLAELLTDDETKAVEAIRREYALLGLFAVDKEDIIFIAYRKEKYHSGSQ